MPGLGSSCFASKNLPVGDGAAGLKYHPEVDPAAPPSVRSQSLPCRNSHFTESGLPSGSGFVPRRSILDPLHSAFPHIRRDVLDHRVSSVARAEPAPPSHIEFSNPVLVMLHVGMCRQTRITVDLAVEILRGPGGSKPCMVGSTPSRLA